MRLAVFSDVHSNLAALDAVLATELTQRLRPFIEIALRAAGRAGRAAISG